MLKMSINGVLAVSLVFVYGCFGPSQNPYSKAAMKFWSQIEEVAQTRQQEQREAVHKQNVLGRIACWDSNQNGSCDFESALTRNKDLDGNGVCDRYDCWFVECWDQNRDRQCQLESTSIARIEDLNGDGTCDDADCYILSCWDLNNDDVCQLDTTMLYRNEDFNGDGACDVNDCE